MGRIIPVDDKDIIISVDGVPAGLVDSIDFKKGEVVSQQVGLMRGKIRFFLRGGA